MPRIRAGPKAAALRSMFSRVRANPSTRRSVWLVLGGGMLSRSRLANALARDVPEPHVLQLATAETKDFPYALKRGDTNRCGHAVSRKQENRCGFTVFA